MIEKLTKFTGERHELLTPGEYTQLTGRAGRRGIDDRSATPSCCGRRSCPSSRWPRWRRAARFALALGVPADLQHGRQPGPPLRAGRGPPPAEPVVRPVPGRPGGGARSRPARARSRQRSSGSRPRPRCERGDVEEYRRARCGRRAGRASRPSDRRARRSMDAAQPAAARATSSCVGRRRAVAVLQRRPPQGPTARVHAVDETGKLAARIDARRLRPSRRDRVGAGRAARAVQPEQPRRSSSEVGAALAARPARRPAAGGADGGAGRRGRATPPRPPGGRLPRPRRATCGPRCRPSGSSASSPTCDRRIARPHRVAGPRFDRGAAAARGLGLPRRLGAHRSRASVLARTYHECDLLVAEAIDHGPARRPRRRRRWPRLVSCFTYEHRSRDPPPAAVVPVGRRARAGSSSSSGSADELRPPRRRPALPAHPPARPGFVRARPRLGAGDGLGDVLEDEELSGGDFVRNVKQLIDLLRQLADVAPVPATRRGRPTRRPTRCSAAWWRRRRHRPAWTTTSPSAATTRRG